MPPAQDLAGSVYGNPHTEAGGGGDGSSAAAIEDARAATLAMCRASPADYECVFTSGATGGDAAVAAQASTFFVEAAAAVAPAAADCKHIFTSDKCVGKATAKAAAAPKTTTQPGTHQHGVELQQQRRVAAVAAAIYALSCHSIVIRMQLHLADLVEGLAEARVAIEQCARALKLVAEAFPWRHGAILPD